MSSRQKFYVTLIEIVALACAIGIVLLYLMALPALAQEDQQTLDARARIEAVTRALTTPVAVYRRHGAVLLNDLAATPGAVGTMTTAQLCAASFRTGTVRNVPESEKQAVCSIYGIPRAHCTGAEYEIDHLISLELGGTNDRANLWPQPYFPKPGAKEKDVVENWLHAQVCAGKMPLATAQHSIATDWYAIYLNLNPITHP